MNYKKRRVAQGLALGFQSHRSSKQKYNPTVWQGYSTKRGGVYDLRNFLMFDSNNTFISSLVINSHLDWV